MNLLEASEGQEYIIKNIETDDEEFNAFLFSLGCYLGEAITKVAAFAYLMFNLYTPPASLNIGAAARHLPCLGFKSIYTKTKK